MMKTRDTIPRICEDVEHQEYSYIAGSLNW